MLKMTAPSEILISDRLEVDDSENGDGIGGVKIAKKLEKSKDQKKI